MQSPELPPEMPRKRQVHYYSVFRFMPDPIREEFINVAVAMTDEAGQYSRLEFNSRIKTRLDQMGAGEYHAGLISYFERLKANYDVAGSQVLTPGLTLPALSKDVLDAWTKEHGSLLRMTPVRVFLSDEPSAAYDELFQRYVGSQRQQDEAAEAEAIAPEAERATVVNEFVRALQHIQNFDTARIRRDESFRGRSRHHWLDVVVSGDGAGASFAHALPFRAKETKPLFLHRGAVLDAAEDVSEESIKMALYDEPPADRRDLLAETSDLLQQHDVRMVRRGEIGRIVELFDRRLTNGH